MARSYDIGILTRECLLIVNGKRGCGEQWQPVLIFYSTVSRIPRSVELAYAGREFGQPTQARRKPMFAL